MGKGKRLLRFAILPVALAAVVAVAMRTTGGTPVQPARRAVGPAPLAEARGADPRTVDPDGALFRDAAVPLEARYRAMGVLARRGDARSTALLMALGNENTYLNFAALRALGTVPRNPRSS